jgi:hypothetical protein
MFLTWVLAVPSFFGRGLADHQQIRLLRDEQGDPFAQYRVIVYHQNADRVRAHVTTIPGTAARVTTQIW